LSTLEVFEDHLIDELDITVDIGHSYPHELIVDLISPQSTLVRLHANSFGGPGPSTRYDLYADPDGPGSMADFEGESTAGTWTLSVRDTGITGPLTGVIRGFVLHVTSPDAFECEVSPCSDPIPTESPDQLVVGKTIDEGDGSVDLVFAWDSVAGVAGYHVLQSADPRFETSVDLTGRTDGANTLTAVGAGATTPALSFFQVRAVNSCSQESP
jgi:hypothetical protein